MNVSAQLWLVLVLSTGCAGKHSDDTATATDCGAWAGIQAEGTVWKWDLDVLTTTTDLVSTVTALGDGRATIESTYSYSTTYHDYSNDITAVYSCDADGLSLLSTSNVYDNGANSGGTQGTLTTTYDTPYLLLPPDLSAGDTWQATVKGTSVDSGMGSTTTFDYTIDSDVVGEDDVSVTAGDYSAMKVDSDEAGSSVYRWWAEDVGEVQAEDRDLVAYEP